MRIISGKYRGKKLKEFDLETTRPTLDRVKESIFNLIQFDVANAVVLDLFSGTGALGIEAISRGAKQTFLVDKNTQAIKIINENLKGIEGKYKVINSDYLSFLQNNKTKFDIVLLDPPFATDFGINAINHLIENNMIEENGIIIFETADEKELDFKFNGYIVDRRKYGTVAVYKITKQ